MKGAEESTILAIASRDPIDLAASIGGLVLVPTNAHHVAQLEALACLVLSGKATGNLPCPRAFIRSVCEGPLMAWAGQQDDPWDFPFTEAFTFHGGSYIFVPGGTDTMFILRAMASAITHIKSSLDIHFRSACTRMILATAIVSNTVANRIQLVRNMAAPGGARNVLVPPTAEFDRLKSAVTFSESDLAERLHLGGASFDDLVPLCARIEREQLSTDHDLDLHPIFQSGDRLVVLAPHLLGHAVIHHLRARAFELGVQRVFALSFHMAVTSAAGNSMKLLGATPIMCDLEQAHDHGQSLASSYLWRIDLDKFLVACVITDAFACDSQKSLFDPWDAHDVDGISEAARANVEAYLSRVLPDVSIELLTMVLCEGMGRDSFISVPAALPGRRSALMFSAADMETLVFSETDLREPVLLWKYALACESLLRTTRPLSFAPLDIYGLWKQRNRRFFLEDDAVNRMVGMHIGSFGEPMRNEAARRFDWHAVRYHRADEFVEVGLEHGPDAPIYTPRIFVRDMLQLVVLVEGATIWVTTSASVDLGQTTAATRIHHLDVIRAVAYWVWQFSIYLREDFSHLAQRRVAHIEVDLKSDKVARMPTSSLPTGPGFDIEAAEHRICLTIHSWFFDRYTKNDNVAERELASRLVESLLIMTGHTSMDASARVAAVIDHAAPTGPKRMIHNINTGELPELVGAAMAPSVRYVQEFDAARTRLQVATWLRDDLGDGATPHTGDPAKKALNRVVQLLYNHMRECIGQCDQVDVLEYLLLKNEALVKDDANREYTLASHLACFPGASEMIRRIARDLPRQAEAAIAIRFLIEYVAAEPPTGTRPMSNALFDECMSIAAEIVALGVASDVLNLHLADVQVRIHENGFSVERGTYQEAVEEIQLIRADDIVRGALTTRQDAESKPSSSPLLELARLDEAARAEFGYTISDIVAFARQIISIAEAESACVINAERGHLVHRLVTGLGWNEETVSNLLDLLSLDARPDFLQPPDGFQKSDIWPWKFNRGLSYLRRPFVRVRRGEHEVVFFSPGFVYRATIHLVRLCTEGRLKASTRKMKNIMSEFTRASSQSFNAYVTKIVRDLGFEAREQVSKIGTVRLRDGPDDLGDIDVLVVDPWRKRLYLLECKDFSMARMPLEISTDLQELFIGRPDRRSAQERHLRRMQWVSDHLGDTLSWLSISGATQKWSVHGAMVLSGAFASPLLKSARLPVWSIRDLKTRDVLKAGA